MEKPEAESQKSAKRKRKRVRVTLLRESYEALKKKAKLCDERYDRLLRLQAEFDNARKRMAKERTEFIKYANEDLICKFLPVLDNFERALVHVGEGQNARSILEGIKLIQKQMNEVLTNYGLKQIPSVGEKFDPNKHEAIMKVESETHEDGTVIEEVQKGYTLNDRLIRPAAVKVAVKKKTVSNQ